MMLVLILGFSVFSSVFFFFFNMQTICLTGQCNVARLYNFHRLVDLKQLDCWE